MRISDWSSDVCSSDLFPSGGKFANSTSGDDLRNKVIEKTVWKNVYSDGTIGATEHESLIATWDYSKTKKTRVAILQFVYRNGEFFSVKHVACTPYTREIGRAHV